MATIFRSQFNLRVVPCLTPINQQINMKTAAGEAQYEEVKFPKNKHISQSPLRHTYSSRKSAHNGRRRFIYEIDSTDSLAVRLLLLCDVGVRVAASTHTIRTLRAVAHNSVNICGIFVWFMPCIVQFMFLMTLIT